jgi:hypothetical protein
MKRGNKKWNEINVEQNLCIEDFCQLFTEKLPLNEEEKLSLNGYYMIYETFIDADVKPIDAWIATRNLFGIKNQQIKERLEQLNKK